MDRGIATSGVPGHWEAPRPWKTLGSRINGSGKGDGWRMRPGPLGARLARRLRRRATRGLARLRPGRRCYMNVMQRPFACPASNQCFDETERNGLGWAAAAMRRRANSARVNHRASSSSSSRRCTVCVTACAVKPKHQRRRKGPRLRRVIFDRVRLRLPFPSSTSRAHRILQRFTPVRRRPAMVE